MARHRRVAHKPLSIDSSHWRSDGQAKVRYPTQRDAQLAASDRSADIGYDLDVYQCAFCNGWHMARVSDRR